MDCTNTTNAMNNLMHRQLGIALGKAKQQIEDLKEQVDLLTSQKAMERAFKISAQDKITELTSALEEVVELHEDDQHKRPAIEYAERVLSKNNKEQML